MKLQNFFRSFRLYFSRNYIVVWKLNKFSFRDKIFLIFGFNFSINQGKIALLFCQSFHLWIGPKFILGKCLSSDSLLCQTTYFVICSNSLPKIRIFLFRTSLQTLSFDCLQIFLWIFWKLLSSLENTYLPLNVFSCLLTSSCLSFLLFTLQRL